MSKEARETVIINAKFGKEISSDFERIEGKIEKLKDAMDRLNQELDDDLSHIIGIVFRGHETGGYLDRMAFDKACRLVLHYAESKSQAVENYLIEKLR